tara:strand:+ start:134 stop:241 length:108 start_codon:yes stop_codon:yes gene_type:complete
MLPLALGNAMEYDWWNLAFYVDDPHDDCTHWVGKI